MLKTDVLMRVIHLPSDVRKTTKIKILGFSVTIDIEKAFDSLDHSFSILTLQKYSFAKHFIL